MDRLSSSDPNVSLVLELGSLSVKEVEFNKIQEELEATKKDIVDKDKLLTESLDDKETLKKQMDSVKQSLIDAKHMVWDLLYPQQLPL